MTIYFDPCALNRLADDLSQPRVRREAESIVRILDLVAAGTVLWTASTVLQAEIRRDPDPIRQLGTLKLLSNAAEILGPTPATLQRAADLSSHGLAYMDALHLAVAEQGEVESLITTDDRFLKQVRTRLQINHPELINPVDWIERRLPWLLPHPRPSAK